MEKKYIPQVGDVVRLINSNDNWASKRDSPNGKSMEDVLEKTPIVTIAKVMVDEYEGYVINFKGDEGWQWTTRNHHFELVTPIKEKQKNPSNTSHNKALIKLLKQIKDV